jgi:hypothetical protein
MVHELSLDGVFATYDQHTETISIKFEGELTCKLTLEVHSWLRKLAPEVGIANIRGVIFDYRNVSTFDKYYLTTFRVVNRKIEEDYDFSRIPTSLVARNAYQEQMLSISLRVAAAANRFQLVKDLESAQYFIKDWHQHN